jgi:hypothetical protein
MRAQQAGAASLIVLCVLCAGAVSAAPRAHAPAPAHAPDLPILFDMRDPSQRPTVAIEAFGGRCRMLIDTGASFHAIGPRAAGVALERVQAGDLMGTDYRGEAIRGIRVPSWDVRLPDGWPPLGAEISVTTWVHLNQDDFFDPGRAHFDGVIAPIRLTAAHQVVVLDFITDRMSLGTWSDADARLDAGDRALTPTDGTAVHGDKLVVPALVGDDTVLLALDTGAATSVLYVPRADDLPGSVSRTTTRLSRVRVGDVDTKVTFALIEPRESVAFVEPVSSTERASPPRFGFVGADPGFAGLLGMDVLRSCVVAFDAERLRVRCRREPPASLSFDMSSMRTLGPSPHIVQVGRDGLPLRQRADGGYDWIGRHLAAHIGKDGKVKLAPKASGGGFERMDADEERRWFEEETSDLLTALSRADEQRTVRAALAALPRYLSAILDDARFSMAERRRLLFLLWDEMAERDDRERGWAGARARALIDLFIQRRLPAGAPGAYSDAELAALNRTRPGAARFEPYAPIDELLSGALR